MSRSVFIKCAAVIKGCANSPQLDVAFVYINNARRGFYLNRSELVGTFNQYTKKRRLQEKHDLLGRIKGVQSKRVRPILGSA